MQDYKDWVYIGLIVVFGAISHATKIATVKKDDEIVFHWLDWFIALPTAMFAGLLFTLGSQFVSEDIIFHGLSGGIGAFLGLQGLNRFADAVLELLVRSVKGNNDDR